jgi:endonuclease YncB( thermonuclease family)
MKITIKGKRRQLMDDTEPPYDPTRGRRRRQPPRGWYKLVILLLAAATMLLVGFLLLAPHRVSAENYTQTAPVPLRRDTSPLRVIDGDTIVIDGRHIRLWGIDAPELGQNCPDKWPAGQKAKGFLIVLVLNRAVTCDDRGKDQYGRTLGVCHADGDEINQVMVRTGNAWAYAKYARAYVLDEIAARQARAGLWAHNCPPAWEFRHAKP